MAKKKVPAVGSRVLVKKSKKPLSQLSPLTKQEKSPLLKEFLLPTEKRNQKGKKVKQWWIN